MGIRSLKLISGIDLIGDINEVDATTVVVKNPMEIKSVHTPDGLAVSLVPFFVFSTDERQSVTLHEHNILKEYEPQPELIDNYLKSTTQPEPLTGELLPESVVIDSVAE